MKPKKHFGDYTDSELKYMSPEKLIAIIKDVQDEDNFIIMTDSYKMTHHLLYPDKLEEVCSYLEPRSGEMPYTVFFGLQYYIKRYLAGIRITPEKIEAARAKAKAHFGFDCFDDEMWYHIWNEHGGKLPLEIKAVPEGSVVRIKNVLMTIRNTDKKCAALTNITETILMKVWATNTVAAYVRIIKELMVRYHAMTSDAPAFLIDFMHHDFGYRGANSEESARILGTAALTSFKGTDTMGALVLSERYYGEPMAGFSVIASEHSVMCAYGSKDEELEAYRSIISKVKAKAKNFNPISGVIILSLVSDTFNIYRVCNDILPALKDEFIGWKNDHGIPLKIVVRPDSGDPRTVLFGDKKVTQDTNVVNRMVTEYGETVFSAMTMVEYGVFRILMDKFGSTTNSKGYKVLHPQIGVLQGDGVSMNVIAEIYVCMAEAELDTMNLVFGSGGKLLQAHDRDEQGYAIKATHVTVDGKGVSIEKNPITDKDKKSKKGFLKLVRTNEHKESWKNFKTVQSGDPEYDQAEDVLDMVFLDGDLYKDFTLMEVRENAMVSLEELVCEKCGSIA